MGDASSAIEGHLHSRFHYFLVTANPRSVEKQVLYRPYISSDTYLLTSHEMNTPSTQEGEMQLKDWSVLEYGFRRNLFVLSFSN
jgi:hypothetical protein